LPQYRDATNRCFILSGAEPGSGSLAGRPSIGRPQHGAGYIIHRYRPRLEGLFARIERWTRLLDGDTHWRSISKDNVLTLYGSDDESRIAEPRAPSDSGAESRLADSQAAPRVFSWLVCETRDDKGNAIRYRYKAEDGINAISAVSANAIAARAMMSVVASIATSSASSTAIAQPS
jgi:hypothetical protein